MSASNMSASGMPASSMPSSAPAGSPSPAPSPTSNGRSARRVVVGTVVSDKMDKTITVQLDRLVKHVRYGKYLKRSTTYKAHDEENVARLGDQVEIVFARRLSKTKNWRLVRVLRTGQVQAVRGDEDREKVVTRPVTRPAPPAAKVAGDAAAPEVSS